MVGIWHCCAEDSKVIAPNGLQFGQLPQQVSAAEGHLITQLLYISLTYYFNAHNYYFPHFIDEKTES